MEDLLKSGGAFGIVVYALLKIIEILAAKLFAKKEEAPELKLDPMTQKLLDDMSTSITELRKNQDDIRDKTRTLFDWHDKSDQDGVKLWYVPRSLYKAQKDTVDTCLLINSTQNQMLSQMEGISRRLENVEREVMINGGKKGTR